MDQKLLFLINREWTNPALDRFMATVTTFDVWTWLIVLLGLWIVKKGGFRARAFVVCALLIVGINDGVVGRTLKRLADRPRPHQALNDVRQVDLAGATPRVLAVGRPLKVKMSRSSLEDVEGRSFPSGHTINCFSAALVCAVFYRRRGWLAFIPAAVVGYSRIYTGNHWPSDVVATVFIAFGSTFLLLAALEWLWRRHGARLLPTVRAAHSSLLAA